MNIRSSATTSLTATAAASLCFPSSMLKMCGATAATATATATTATASDPGQQYQDPPTDFRGGMKAFFMRQIAANAQDGPISPKYGVHYLPLVRKTTQVQGTDGKVCPVRTFTFGLKDPAASLNETFDLGLGDILKMHITPDPTNNPNGMTHKSYSPTDVSKAGTFDVTVKIYPGGTNSQILDNLKIGDKIGMSGPWPPKFMQNKRNRVSDKQVNLVAFGVGMTEIYHVAKAELERTTTNNNNKSKNHDDDDDGGGARMVSVLYSNRYKEDAFFTSELRSLQEEYGPDRFQLNYIYSRDDVPGARKGRVDASVLQDVFQLPSSSSSSSSPSSTSWLVGSSTNDGGGVTTRGGRHHHEEHRFVIVGSKSMIAESWNQLKTLGFDRTKHGLFIKKK